MRGPGRRLRATDAPRGPSCRNIRCGPGSLTGWILPRGAGVPFLGRGPSESGAPMGRRRTQASERDPSLSTMTLARGATLRLVGWPGAARARRLLAQQRGPLPPTHESVAKRARLAEILG